MATPRALVLTGYGINCDYETEYASSTCDATGDVLTYCSETDVIGTISCAAQCIEWYGAMATGYCGIQPETGYNGCVCEYSGCDFDPWCYDALWLVSCLSGEEFWTDCNVECMGAGFSKGVCSLGACSCG